MRRHPPYRKSMDFILKINLTNKFHYDEEAYFIQAMINSKFLKIIKFNGNYYIRLRSINIILRFILSSVVKIRILRPFN